MLLGGVVDEHVETAEGAHRALDRGPACIRVADVAAVEHGLSTGFFHEPPCLARVAVLVEVEERDARPLLRERDGDGPPDPAVTARDQGAPAFQAARRVLADGLRQRVHVGLETGLAVLLLRRDLRRRVLRAHGFLRVGWRSRRRVSRTRPRNRGFDPAQSGNVRS